MLSDVMDESELSFRPIFVDSGIYILEKVKKIKGEVDYNVYLPGRIEVASMEIAYKNPPVKEVFEDMKGNTLVFNSQCILKDIKSERKGLGTVLMKELFKDCIEQKVYTISLISAQDEKERAEKGTIDPIYFYREIRTRLYEYIEAMYEEKPYNDARTVVYKLKSK